MLPVEDLEVWQGNPVLGGGGRAAALEVPARAALHHGTALPPRLAALLG